MSGVGISASLGHRWRDCQYVLSLSKKERERKKELKIVRHWNIEHSGEMLQVYNLDCVEEIEQKMK